MGAARYLADIHVTFRSVMLHCGVFRVAMHQYLVVRVLSGLGARHTSLDRGKLLACGGRAQQIGIARTLRDPYWLRLDFGNVRLCRLADSFDEVGDHATNL